MLLSLKVSTHGRRHSSTTDGAHLHRVQEVLGGAPEAKDTAGVETSEDAVPISDCLYNAVVSSHAYLPPPPLRRTDCKIHDYEWEGPFDLYLSAPLHRPLQRLLHPNRVN